MDESAKQLLEAKRDEMSVALATIKRLLPEDYRLTLICRHLSMPNAQLILTEDLDLESAANALLQAEVVK